MKHSTIIALALLTTGSSAYAQQVIGAGGQIQQLPPIPTPSRGFPDLRIERRGATAETRGPEGEGVLVRTLHVTGARRFSEGQLIAVSHFKPGSVLTLGDMRRLAARITDFYTAAGYFVARAYVPAQVGADGSLTIAVIEGHYGAVSVDNHTNLSTGVARNVLSGLKSGDIVTAAPLERRLLLLSDIPGVVVQSTLSPGDRLGTSDLTVKLTPGPRISGSLEADNGGDLYTGVYRGGATVYLNDPLGLGDQASVRFLTSGGGLNYVRGAYQLPVAGATVGVAYASFWYHLGDTFESLHADGEEQIASAYASYPLIRSRNDNLYALADVDYRTFRDSVGLTSSETHRRAGVVTVGLNGDHRDSFWGGGSDTYSVAGVFGDLDIESPDARAADQATARSNGGYAKVVASVDRAQELVGPLSLYVAARGQWASKNLDISEKMELGGAYAVRAYAEGEDYGDEGYVATAEARLDLGRPWKVAPGRWQAFGFVDTGSVRLSKTPWYPGPNTVTLSGAGAGLRWSANNNFLITVSYAFKLGGGRDTSTPDRSGQFWFQVVKFF